MENQPIMKELRNKVELYMMIFEPYEILHRRVKSTKDIFLLKTFLKLMPCSDITIRYLAQIVLSDIESKKRFRKVACLKVIRTIIKNSKNTPNLEPDTVRILFRIYRSLIFDISESGQWAVSVLIKDQILSDNEIQWLIDNWEYSTHLLNRLLLYPRYNPLIAVWAEHLYKSGKIPTNRMGELVALAIQKDIPPYIDCSDTNLLISAISRARLSNMDKILLLKGFARPENYETLLDVALRLNMPLLVKYILYKLGN